MFLNLIQYMSNYIIKTNKKLAKQQTANRVLSNHVISQYSVEPTESDIVRKYNCF